MIKILIVAFVLIGLWLAFEVTKWWKETEDDIRIWPDSTRKNKK